MDGTLTVAHIDFTDMRNRTGIPVGDLFTVMESWQPAAIQRAMTIILDIEAEAAARVTCKEGLDELLLTLKELQVPVALVTRNTQASVQAFFTAIGPEAAAQFQPVLTREFPFVKPDPRLLLHVAQVWGVEPSELLMVGDSWEDVEVGNAAGTASCLVAGGGNEKPGAGPATPPPGAVPTFTVSGLLDLRNRLLNSSEGACPAHLPAGLDPGAVALGWPARVAAGEVVAAAGAPPPGLQFLTWLQQQGALRAGAASFPRMGDAAGGLATCPDHERGSRVLHLGCGSGALTKMMASQGMQVLGLDMDVGLACARGLQARPLSCAELSTGSLRGSAKDGFDAALLHHQQGLDLTATVPSASGALARSLCRESSLAELLSVLAPSGYLCVELPIVMLAGGNEVGDASAHLEDWSPDTLLASLAAAGFTEMVQEVSGAQLRLVARKP
ncbi:HAD-like domain-containing protein [Haematococcus lacustris]